MSMQENEKPVLTVLNFITEDQCFLGGPVDRCYSLVYNHADHTKLLKANSNNSMTCVEIFFHHSAHKPLEEVEMTELFQ